MARPRRDAEIDLKRAHELTVGLIERFTCPTGKKAQVFLRDAKAPGLRVRASNTGAKSFVFEAKLSGQTIRRAIGDIRTWSIEAARIEARRLATMIDNGIDPREVDRQREAEKAAQSVTVGEAWARYLVEGKPKRRDAWKEGYRADLLAMAAAGGEQKKRGQGLTRPGPLNPLMTLSMAKVTEDALAVWYATEAKRSKHQAARALMMFRGFLRWGAARPEYRSLVNRDAGKAASIIESLPAMKRRTDALEAAQVAGWWRSVEQLGNRTASTYLRALLLTGARKEELAALTWENVDLRWRKLTIADKVEDTRTIPLTPFLAQLFAMLPKLKDEAGNQNPFVFVSMTGKSGRITDVRSNHARVLKEAGIDQLTIHGLRRSFSLLGEASGAPAGAIAQVMGHKPSSTAEGYRPRSIDALRPYLEQIEAHILKLAGIQFAPEAMPGKMTLVA
jgi:integrase